MAQPEHIMSPKTIFKEFKKNRLALFGSIIIIIVTFIAISAPIIIPYNPREIVGIRLQPPSYKHVFGTDELGRDLLSRIIWGAKATLLVGVISAILSSIIGVIIGAIAGFYGGIFDIIVMKVCEIFLVIPSFFLYIAVASVLRSRSLYIIVVMLGMTMWPTIARIVRSEFLSLRERPFIVAAKSLGSSNLKIILDHMLPNTMAPIIVTTSMNMSSAILVASALSFLGLGDPTMIEWGNMLQTGGRVMRLGWWVAFFPGIAIFLVSLAFNVIGDGIRDALDPRLKGV